MGAPAADHEAPTHPKEIPNPKGEQPSIWVDRPWPDTNDYIDFSNLVLNTSTKSMHKSFSMQHEIHNQESSPMCTQRLLPKDLLQQAA